ncbi:hypothetical protein BKA93DRAFT_350755 [Sparassis latifolia]
MHAALLIDEILQVILGQCSDWPDQEYRRVLCQIAKCCRAWKDPALDRLWNRLDNIEPLLRLLPMQLLRRNASLNYNVHVDNLANFRTYASRVRHVTHRGALPVSPLLQSIILMPKLSHVVLRGEGCEVAPCFKTSRALRHLNITLNHYNKERPHSMLLRSYAVATYLDSLNAWDVDLQTLRLRGRLSAQLSMTLASLTTLRTLLLYAGDSLTAQMLLAIANFPRLRRLDVQATHINPSTFFETLSPSAPPLFPTLQNLKISCQPDFLAALLQTLPVGVLQKVQIDTAYSPISFHPSFERLSLIGSHSLEELCVEAFIPSDDVEYSGAVHSDRALTISALRPLAGLKALRRFSIHGTAPPDFCDGDIEQIAAWWPRLSLLNLGLIEDFHADAFSRLTPAVFFVLAKLCRELKSLTLPVDILDSALPLPPPGAHLAISLCSLRSLSIGTAPLSLDCISVFVRHVVAAFPGVENVDSTSWGGYWLEHAEECIDLRPGAVGPLSDRIVVGDRRYRFVTHS